MTRTMGFSSPLLLGFDDVERALERLSKAAGDGYPPYNIERLPQTAERGDTLRLILAVAGFAPDDLEITVAENELIVRGRKREEEGRTFLYRGIAQRQFQKTFVLADGIEVAGAQLADGLLAIDLVRPTAERAVRRVPINGRG
ncbi:MAG TPA: Hsp20 family protein [Bauldia sp.]|nr:Hsp20 family protein [Bauldia sp.]